MSGGIHLCGSELIGMHKSLQFTRKRQIENLAQKRKANIMGLVLYLASRNVFDGARIAVKMTV